MKKRVFASISLLLILMLLFSLVGCGTRANWAAQKSDTKMNELNLREANGSEKYIIFAALDEDGELIASGSSTPTKGYAVVGYTGLVAELIIPDEFAPTGGEAMPVTKVLAVDPYSAYKCYRDGVSYTGEDARLQNNTVITTISFGANMTYVGAGVCSGMVNLYDVIFTRSGDSVEIGDRAFAACPNLSRLTYSRTDDYMNFGEYPQTQVTDSAIVTALNAQAGTLPTASNSQNWTSYHYYNNERNDTDFMWYIDLEYNDVKYRGVYFTQYRPYLTNNTSYRLYNGQDNGYNVNTVYWFRFDPIRWRILAEADGELFIFSECILDCQQFYRKAYQNRTIGDKTIYPNNYAESDIRNWLNENFYNDSFNPLQKGYVQLKTIDNETTALDYEQNPYLCNDTQDRVFLLSYKEARNASYGFASSTGTADLLRRKNYTDYAIAQGVILFNSDSSIWWLRSPYNDTYNRVSTVAPMGQIDRDYVHYACFGVVPAMWIRPA